MLRFGTTSQIRPDLSSRVENYWLDLLILSIRIKITKYKFILFRRPNGSLYLGKKKYIDQRLVVFEDNDKWK